MTTKREPVWRISTASTNQECVAVAITDRQVLIRHSKDPAGPMLSFTSGEWGAFLAGVRRGEFDLGDLPAAKAD